MQIGLKFVVFQGNLQFYDHTMYNHANSNVMLCFGDFDS